MKVTVSMHAEQSHGGLFHRLAHDVSAALDWLAGPAMSQQERRDRVVAEAQGLKHDTSAMHLP